MFWPTHLMRLDVERNILLVASHSWWRSFRFEFWIFRSGFSDSGFNIVFFILFLKCWAIEMILKPMMNSHIKSANHFMGLSGLSVAPEWRTVLPGGGRAHPSAFFPQPLPECLGLSSLSQWTHFFCGILLLKCARIQIQAGSLSRELYAVSIGPCTLRIQIPVHPADW